MHFPAPTTDLDGLHDLLASTQAVTQRWLDKAKTKDEPPSITDIANLTLSTRRIALLHRDIYKLENPSLAFRQSRNRARNRNLNPDTSSFNPEDLSDPVEPNDPDILSKNSSSSTLTYSREISRYVAARIVASIKSKPEDAADCCPDLYDEMALMKSNPAYHAETLTEMTAPIPVSSSDSEGAASDSVTTSHQSVHPVHSVHNSHTSPISHSHPPNLPDPAIFAQSIPSSDSVISVALCENSSNHSDNVDPSKPAILSRNASSAASSELHTSHFTYRSFPALARSRAGPFNEVRKRS